MRAPILTASILLAGLTGLTVVACGNDVSHSCALGDADCDGVPDSLGAAVLDANGNWAQADVNGDGIGDGPAVDINGDGLADGILIDTDGDGLGDAVDFDGDLIADYPAGSGGGSAVTPGAGGTATGAATGTATGALDGTATGTATGEATGTATGEATGTATGAATGTATGDPTILTGCELQATTPVLAGSTTAQYFKWDATRAGKGYKFLANGWGGNWNSHTIKYAADTTAFQVESLSGGQDNGAPAGFPTMFCGSYSGETSSGSCGLPAEKSSLTSLKTAARWSGGAGEYNMSWDVWMGTGNNHDGYFMVWLRDPPSYQPAGNNPKIYDVVVPGQPGSWTIHHGTVNGRPIVNYVRPQGNDYHSLSFDLLAFMKDADNRGLNYGGSNILSVAAGFEIWESVSNVTLEEFCVEPL